MQSSRCTSTEQMNTDLKFQTEVYDLTKKSFVQEGLRIFKKEIF